MSRLTVGRKRKLEIKQAASVKRIVGSSKQARVVETVKSDENSKVKERFKSADSTEAKTIALETSVTRSETLFLDVRKSCQWREIIGENLSLELTQFYNKEEADVLLKLCEQEFDYNVGDLSTVKLFGKRISIPRKQVAHGDTGLTYTFSGNTVPARPWTPLLTKIRDQISQVTDQNFNFVLVNRYNDGNDYIGEHKDAERDLIPGHPIASLTFGQPRDFVFKHQDSRGKQAKRKIDPVTMLLEHGMLLLMKHPTNSFWYHSLPRRTKALGVRINMTFRKMNPSHCKPV